MTRSPTFEGACALLLRTVRGRSAAGARVRVRAFLPFMVENREDSVLEQCFRLGVNLQQHMARRGCMSLLLVGMRSTA